MSPSISWQTHVSTWFRFLVGNRLAPYHAMPTDAAQQIFRMLKPSSSDVLYDLGCGDGQLLLKACNHYNVKHCVGYELNTELYNTCIQQIQNHKLQDRITVYNENALNANLSDASMITLYLSVAGNKSLLPLLLPKLRTDPHTKIVSFLFPIEPLQPVQQCTVSGGIPVMMYNGQSI